MKTEQDIELTKLPKSAMPVVRYIRENVGPFILKDTDTTYGLAMQFGAMAEGFYAMFDRHSADAFMKWVYELVNKDPQAAVDAIWGKE